MPNVNTEEPSRNSIVGISPLLKAEVVATEDQRMGLRAAPPRTIWAFQGVLAIGASPAAAICARRNARSIAYEWGVGDLADTIELVTSELVTNAVTASADRDGRSRFGTDTGLAYIHLRLSTDRRAALIEVWDECSELPVPACAGADDESGRGLMLIDALAERWGWDRPGSGRGKIVWALVGPSAL